MMASFFSVVIHNIVCESFVTRDEHFYHYHLMLFLFVFSFANLPRALYNIIFTPRFQKNTPAREVDTQYSEQRFAVRKRKIITQRN